jgi:hypothetical protein
MLQLLAFELFLFDYEIPCGGQALELALDPKQLCEAPGADPRG